MTQARAFRLPGFGLSMGVTLLWMGLLIALPLSALTIKAFTGNWEAMAAILVSKRALYAFVLTFGGAFLAAIVNGVAGLVVAWVLVRYEFPGRRLIDALVDVPFALPTAVAGLTFADLYVPNGWLGRWLVPLGINVAFTRLGVVVVLIFVSLPFVVRTIQPVLQDLDPEFEEAAMCLGASRLQTFWYVVFPALAPSWLTGMALAFARGVGEYGSVIFISGNLPWRTEIASVLIVTQLEQFHLSEATAIAVVMLTVSFLVLGLINIIQRWNRLYE